MAILKIGQRNVRIRARPGVTGEVVSVTPSGGYRLKIDGRITGRVYKPGELLPYHTPRQKPKQKRPSVVRVRRKRHTNAYARLSLIETWYEVYGRAPTETELALYL